MMSGSLCLTIEGLAIARAGIALASNISFTLVPGEGLIVTGANGSGKSTLLRVLAGLLSPVRGTVTLDGGGDTYPDIGPASHYLGHLNAMKPALSVAENLEFWQKFNGPAHRSMEEALDQTGLSHTRDLPFAYLSTGQKRRISIAKLLLNHRPLWILDEPTAGLDAASADAFAGMMQAHLDSGGMLIAATHSPLGLTGLQSLHIGANVTAAQS